MLYQQDVDNIQLMILTLDGGLLDLNRLRYNYFNHTCKSYEQSITKEVFSNYLGNMNTMYDCSPIQDKITNSELNKTIEKDLFEYSKLKQNVKKDGVDELLQFAHQRKIKVAVVSTHKSKRAIQYLQLTGIYNQVDFVIGGDSTLEPFPDSAIIQTIMEQMHIDAKHTLVVANFNSMVIAANKVMANVIYMPDLVEASNNIEARVFRVVRNNLEVINTFLFSKYDSLDLFSPMLGMSRNMSRPVLTTTYNHLVEKYGDDKQLLDLVNQTYHYFLNQLYEDEQSLNDTYFEDSEDETKETDLGEVEKKEAPIEENKEVEEPESQDDITSILSALESQEDHEEVESPVINDNQSPVTQDTIATYLTPLDDSELDIDEPTSAISLEATRVNELMDIINGKEVPEEKKESETVLEEPVEEEKKTFLNHLVSFIYTLLVSTIIVLVSMFSYVAIADFLNDDGLINNVCRNVIDFYILVVNSFYYFIFDGLSSFIGFIPSYDSLLKGNSVLSTLSIQAILFIIFNTMIIYIFKGIYYIITGEDEDDE